MFDGSNSVLSMAAVGILTGLAVWGLLYGALLVFGGQQARIKSRVRRFVREEGQPVLDETEIREQQRQTLFAELDSRWEDQSLFKKLSEELEAADLRLTATELLLMQVGAGAALALVLSALVPFLWFLLAPVGFMLGMVSVRSYVRYLGKRRINRFEDQLPNNLAIIAGSVRGGLSLFQALQLISREASEPSRTEFTRVIQEISLGNTLGTSLEGLVKRVPTEDVEILVTAITMQQQTGGNLTHVLDVVAATIRERQRVRREIRTLTAQQRFSAIVLAALPFLLGLMMFVISPTYISNLFQPGWVLCMPIGAFVLSIIGFFVMRRLADIDI
jgi:tight adherence protein B